MFLRPTGQIAGAVWQDHLAVPGGNYLLTLAGGTHNTTFGHEAAMQFLDANGAVLTSDSVELDYDVDTRGDLADYAIGPNKAPAGSVTVRVVFRNLNGDWVKADAACLLASVPANPDTPVTPDTPATPETPVTPNTPATPDTPVTPETPVTPNTPVTPETPVQPEAANTLPPT